MRAIAHLAGACLTAEGRYQRQRCAWCGAVLLDDDLAFVAIAPLPGEEPQSPRSWEAGTWVEESDGNPRIMTSLGDLESMPDNSCMALEVDAWTSVEAVAKMGRGSS